jgi:hypothetical protein
MRDELQVYERTRTAPRPIRRDDESAPPDANIALKIN